MDRPSAWLVWLALFAWFGFASNGMVVTIWAGLLLVVLLFPGCDRFNLLIASLPPVPYFI
ncbi:MAG TPA: hypothetical protein VGJ97_03455 [Anaerolineaceae bacterium]